MPRDPTNAQISSRLSYRSGPTPDFLRALQSRVAGRSPSPPSDEPEPSYDDYAAYQDDANGGRPPIPRRPPPPRRPKDQAGSGDEDEFGRKRRGEEGEGDDGEKLDEEDGEDERPQVVVLKEGKHLSQVEAENERRKAKGLPPLPEPSAAGSTPDTSASTTSKASNTSTKSSGVTFGKSAKRKAAKDISGEDALTAAANADPKAKSAVAAPPKKKAKKAEKKLLSFGDDA